MTARRLAIVAAVLAIAALVWTLQQRRLVQTREALDAAGRRLRLVQEDLRGAARELERVEKGLADSGPRFRQVLIRVAEAERACAEQNPESRWTEPPLAWPEWDPESPYVWLRKETLPRLPAPVFNANGELEGAVAGVLTLSLPETVQLNAVLRDCLERYRALETGRVELLDEHLPGIAGLDGEKRTISVVPLPEQGARARAEFEAALDSALGEQRAGLLCRLADHWLDSQFGLSGSASKTISLARLPDGAFHITIRSGDSSLSTGMPGKYAWQLTNHIPPHLRPYFSDLLDPAAE